MKDTRNRFSWVVLRRKVAFAATTLAVMGGMVTGAWAQITSNDNFANAAALTGEFGTETFDSTDFTAELGEPSHAGFVPIASAWFKWTAPKSGLVQLDTFGSGFDTLLAVYTGGTDISKLDFLVGNDDATPNGQSFVGSWIGPSLVKFNAIEGTTYFVAVAAYSGMGGTGSLSWAYLSAGIFRFTADSVAVSEMDTFPPVQNYNTTWSAEGARVTVTRVGGASGRATVDLSATDITAVEGFDYTLPTTQLVFEDWEMSKSVVLPVRQNVLLEDHVFNLTLSNPQLHPSESTTIQPPRLDPGHATQSITLLNYQLDPEVDVNGIVNFARSTYRTREDIGTVTIHVVLQGGARPRSISWRINKTGRGGPILRDNVFGLQAGSDYATPDPVDSIPSSDGPADFQSPPEANDEEYGGTFVWNPGDGANKEINIPIINDDYPEFNEDIKVRVFNSGRDDSASPGKVSETTVTILHDDYPAGALDTSHNPDYNLTTEPVDNSTPGANETVKAVAVQADGKTLFAGDFTTYNAVGRNRIARMNEDGSNDASFNPGTGANDFISSMLLDANGRAVIGGGFTSFNGQPRYRIARINVDGSLDQAFNPGLGADGTVLASALQTDGKILIVGEFENVNGYVRGCIARLNTNGSVDETFVATNAFNSVDSVIRAVGISSDGSIYVGGDFNFSVGTNVCHHIARLKEDGSLDFDSFIPIAGADGPVNALAVQPNGRVLIGGVFNTVENRSRRNLARLNADGTLDTSFDPGTGVDGPVNVFALQPDGRILAGGQFTRVNGTRRVGLVRLFASGQVDTSFLDTAYNHFAGIPNLPFSIECDNPTNPRNTLHALALQANGDVIIGGSFKQVGGGRLNLAIQTDDYDFIPYSHWDEYIDGTDGFSRQGYRNRYNVARLLGGETDGPGNYGFLTSSYSIDESAQFLFVKTLRENGTLGAVEATFSLPKVTGTAAAQVGTDYVYNHINPFYDSTWSGTRNLGDGNFGTNNIGLTVVGEVLSETDDIYVTVPRNVGIQGDRKGVFQLDVPSQSDVFFLGGENVPLGSALGRSTAEVTINEVDKTPGTIGFTTPSYAVDENGGTAVISLIRTNGSDGTVSAVFYTANGSATFANYTGKTNTVIFGQGETNKTVSVAIKNDNTIQNDDRTVLLALKSPTGGATLGLTNAVLSIVDDDYEYGRLNFSTTATQTNEYSGTARVTVTRSGGNSGVMEVQVQTYNGTAVQGVNYVGKTNTLHWDNGDATPRTMDVTLLPDGVVMPDLYFNVKLANPTVIGFPTPAVFGSRTNEVVTIVNDDFYGSPQFSAPTYYVDETGGYATLTVSRASGSAQTVSVNFSTVNGTAVSGGPLPNYVATNGTLTFGPGVVSRSCTVPILNDGVVDTSPLFFSVNLSALSPAGAVLGTPTTAQVQIYDTQSLNEPAGSVDPNFDAGVGFNADVFSLTRQPGGSIVAGGGFTTVNGLAQNFLARVSTNGTPDTAFMAGLAGANAPVRAVLNLSDSRLLVGGQFTTFNSVNRNFITRLNTEGGLDTTFDPGSGADAPVFALAEGFVNGARKHYVGGSFNTFNGVASPGLVRLNDNGTVDTSFSLPLGVSGGPVYSVAVYATNTINAGKVVIGGAFTSVNGVPRAGIARLNTDGSLDASFNPGSGANGEVRSVVLQLDGRVLLGGAFTSVAGQPFNRIARLNLNGSIDAAFNVGVGTDDVVYSIALQANNRIVVGGGFSSASGVTRRRITRLMPDGTVDPTINFGTGANSFINTVLVQPDQKLVVGGGFTSFNGEARNRIARLQGGSRTGSGQIEFNASSYSVAENGTNVLLTLRRIGGTSGTGPSGTGALTLTLMSRDETAAAGINYVGVTQQVAFAVGEVEAVVSVPVIRDLQITPDLTAIMFLAGDASALGLQPFATVHIINVDSALRFNSSSYSRNEDAIDGSATIEIVREGSVAGSASVEFATTLGGTAVPGVNYTPVLETVQFLPGDTRQIVRVPVLHNPLVEADRTVILELSTPLGSVLLAPFEAVLTINNVDQAPGEFLFSAPAYAVGESATNAVITILRSNGTSGIASVSIATIAGTATPGIRYLSTNDVLTFADGQSSRTFFIPVFGDTIVQGNQTLTVKLANPTGGATITDPSEAILTILDDDVAVNFTSTAYVVNESDDLVYLSVQRINGSNGVASVNFRTVDGSAKAGINYTAENRTLTFNNGETLKSVAIAVKRDPRVTGDLSFSVLLTNATPGVQLVAPNPATVLIVDDDPGIRLAGSTFSVLENATNLMVMLVRSNANSGSVSINYATADETAIAGKDYVATSGTATFLNGQTVQIITIPILDDHLVQGDRIFQLSIFNPTGGAQLLDPSEASIAILDNDAGVRFTSELYNAVENEVTTTITVTRTNYLDSLVSVDYATLDGTAVEGTDYVGASGTLVFNPGETNKSFTIGLKDDSILKGDRTVLIKLANAVGDAAIVNPGAATLTISDDDGSLVVPAGTALLAEQTSNGVIDPGETVTILFGFRNSGGTNAQNVSATLLATNGVTPVTGQQTYGAMPVGAPVKSQPFTFTASATNGQTVAATFTLRDNGAVIGTGLFTFKVGTSSATFTNGSAIVINDRGANPAPLGASPYPANINVGGLDGTINNLSVTLSNYTHISAGDVGALLVGPTGKKSLLMANAGGFNSLAGITLRFDDAATNSLPLNGSFASGIYKPTSYAPQPTFPAPAPNSGYSNTLAAFTGGNPNGLWSLYIIDDTSPGAGVISNGWALTLTQATPVPSAADLALAMTASPNPGIAGAQLSYTLRVTNFGPATAQSVVVSDALPAGAQFVSASTASGTATNQAGTLTWSVGSLANGAAASLNLVILPGASSSATNSATASSGVTDFYAANNTATLVTPINTPQSDLVISMADSPDPVLAGWPLTYAITVSNVGPATATAVTVTNRLPAGLVFGSVNGSQGTSGLTGNTVWAQLGNLAAGARATVTLVVTPTSIGTVTNTASTLSSVLDPLKGNNTVAVKTVVNAAISVSGGAGGIALHTPGAGSVVDSTASLTSPVVWTPLMTNPPAVLNLPATNGVQFFRVRPLAL